MAMGRSGGRSRGNRTAAGAPRRATPRERDYIDPPFPTDVSPARPTLAERISRGDWVDGFMTVLAAASFVVFCAMFAVVLCAWLGII